MESSGTKQDTVTKTTPIAVYAVAQLMLEHRLPAPLEIVAPSRWAPHLVVKVDTTALDAWLEWMVVTDEQVRPGVRVPGYETVTYTGRLSTAIGDVAVAVKTARRTVRPALVSVPAGGAA